MTLQRLAAIGLLSALLPGWGAARVPPVALSRQALESIAASRIATIPIERQKRNWLGPAGQGSCVHASISNLFAWQGRPDLAAWWRAKFGDGENPPGLTAKLDAAAVPYAQTETSDISFLEWACATRRGAAVRIQGGAHMVCLVGLDDRTATILDPNSPGETLRVDRAAFLQDWSTSHGAGWAVTPLVGPPAPPAPWIKGGSP